MGTVSNGRVIFFYLLTFFYSLFFTHFFFTFCTCFFTCFYSLFFTFFRKFPFEDMSALRAAHEVAYSGLRPLPDVPEETTPSWVRRLIGKCWVSDPNDRPSFVNILSVIEGAGGGGSVVV